MKKVKYEKRPVNYQQLTPLSFLYRTANIYPEKVAWIYGENKATYSELLNNSEKLSLAVSEMGIKRKDVVTVMLPNIPEMIEAHFGIPMSGAILNTLNTRLDNKSILYILKHSKSKLFIFHEDYFKQISKLINKIKSKIKLVLVKDSRSKEKKIARVFNYEKIIESSSLKRKNKYIPFDEWDSITLNYTSGTTGKPKGVLYHHRGAYLMCLNNQMVWRMGDNINYLWTLPMFHCNGWCFPWTIVALGGTQVCLNKITGKGIISALKKYKINYLCGAPIILQMIISELKHLKLKNTVKIMTAASPPPPSTLKKIEQKGFEVTHVYGLTESYGPAVICEWKDEWNELSSDKRAILKSRQGVQYPSLEFLDVKDPRNMKSVAMDGKTIGEVMLKGNIIMKGYLNDSDSNNQAFKGNWFHTGDLAVMHPDGYIELKDRSKDIIISGGENISSIEIEKVLISHKAVNDCAVIGVNDKKWGETPCAFVEINKTKLKENELIAFCKKNLPGFKVPKKIIFTKLPRTSTGKIQKFSLRDTAKKLHEQV